jgi:5-methylcytosine-specific restriction endonuclease McrA
MAGAMKPAQRFRAVPTRFREADFPAFSGLGNDLSENADKQCVANKHDEIAEKVERLARAMVAQDSAAERYARGGLTSSEWVARHARVRPELQAGVFNRDSFICCYCGVKTVPLPILELLGLRLTRGSLTPESFLLISTACSQIKPVTRGGSSVRDNLATSCWRCDATKADSLLSELGWPEPNLGPRPRESWKGLTEHYRLLWEAAGRPEPNRHERWLKVLLPERAKAASLPPPGTS